jgi:hypothetical protein
MLPWNDPPKLGGRGGLTRRMAAPASASAAPQTGTSSVGVIFMTAALNLV